jgi:predicted anti-sigma-YlaC factor YlaD
MSDPPAPQCQAFRAALLTHALSESDPHPLISAHLKRCGACRRRFIFLRRAAWLLALSPPIVTPSAQIGKRLAALLASRQPRS